MNLTQTQFNKAQYMLTKVTWTTLEIAQWVPHGLG